MLPCWVSAPSVRPSPDASPLPSPRPRNIQLTHIFDRRAREKRRCRSPPTASRWTSSIDDLLHSDVDIIVEAVGGVEPAADWIRAALLAGKSVVTANKQVDRASRPGAADARGAAGAAAAVRGRGRRRDADRARDRRRPGRRSHHADRRDPERHDQRRAVADGGDRLRARRRDARGAARAATRKPIRRPISTATTRAPSSRSCARSRSACASTRRRSTSDRRRRSARPTSRARGTRGATIRQIAYADYDRQRVRCSRRGSRPIEVETASLFARTTGPQNAALITGAHSGEIGIFGAGAGGDATAVAVLGDIAAIARDRAAIVPAPVLSNFQADSQTCSEFCAAEAV